MINPLIEVLKTMQSPLLAEADEQLVTEVLFRLLKADMRNWTNAQDFAERHVGTLQAPKEETLCAVDSSIVKSGCLEHREAVQAIVPPTVPNKDVIEIVKQVPALLNNHADLPVDDQFKKLNADFMGVLAPVVEKQIAGLETPLEEKDAQSLSKSWVSLVHKYLKWAIVADTPGPDALKLMLVLGPDESNRRLERAEKIALETGEARS